jgi:hypothetical protein
VRHTVHRPARTGRQLHPDQPHRTNLQTPATTHRTHPPPASTRPRTTTILRSRASSPRSRAASGICAAAQIRAASDSGRPLRSSALRSSYPLKPISQQRNRRFRGQPPKRGHQQRMAIPWRSQPRHHWDELRHPQPFGSMDGSADRSASAHSVCEPGRAGSTARSSATAKWEAHLHLHYGGSARRPHGGPIPRQSPKPTPASENGGSIPISLAERRRARYT